MSQLIEKLRYSKSHEWVKEDDEGNYLVGITDHAQQLLGDMVYVELPEVGRVVASGDEVGVVESVKAASDIYSPLSGEIVAVNEALEKQPELVNQQPYEQGWIFIIAAKDKDEIENLLTVDEYQNHIESDEE